MYHFSDELDIQNLILREDHITRGYEILQTEIQRSSANNENAFIYDNEV